MFLRALHAAPGFFAPFHVLSNTTIGSFPGDIADILRQKGGSLLAYHELDPDHMREAVAYKALTQVLEKPSHLCFHLHSTLVRSRCGGSEQLPLLWLGLSRCFVRIS